MAAPRLSIITPTWNRARLLPGLFASLSRLAEVWAGRPNHSAESPFEHILVDNQSTDGTRACIEEYAKKSPWPVRYLGEGDRGLYDAMNQGAAVARGEGLYFLNDDDRVEAGGLLDLWRLMEREEAGLAFAEVWREEAQTGERRLRRHRQMNFLTLAERSICQQATLYRRAVWQAVGPFDAGLRFAADYDWAMRALRKQRVRAVYGSWPVAVFHLGGLSSDPRHEQAFAAEMSLVRQRYYTEEDLRRAATYRKTWRKWPWGLRLGGRRGDEFAVQNFLRLGRRLLPDPRAWLQL